MDDYGMELGLAGAGDRDRLSELPHSLILVILSFMSMRDVVSTNFLSKRWNNLWKTVPCLNFREYISEGNKVDRVRNFVNRALILWKGPKLQKFEIHIQNEFDRSLSSDIDVWVNFAVEKKVEELYINVRCCSIVGEWVDPIMDSKRNAHWAPQCLYSCSSIRKLSLVCCNLRVDVSPSWNQLERLKIDGFCLSECLVNRILSGSPKLEVFELHHLECYENLNIRSTSLKELKIDKYMYPFYRRRALVRDTGDTVLRIWCPNLEILRMSGLLYSKCLFLNVSSLIDATFVVDPNVRSRSGVYRANELLGETLTLFSSATQHVKKVTLLVQCEKVLIELQKKHLLSPLPNVKFLELSVRYSDLGDMMGILGNFSNLRMLKMHVSEGFGVQTPQKINIQNYLECETKFSKSLLLQLMTVQISSCFRDATIYRFIEFLLRNCSMLEKLVIPANRIPYREQPERLFEVAETLLNMPRSSPIARVIIKKN